MNCDLLRTSTRAVSSRVGGCGGSPTLEARTVEGADLHHERCLSQIIISFAPQIINRPLKLKVVKDNNFNYGQWKELPEECQNNKAESGTCSCYDFFGVREEDLVNQTDLAFAIADLCGPGLGCDEDIEAYCSTVKDVDILRRGFRPAQSDEINVLTYHKAKGLEFDIVFCLEAYRFIMPPYKGVQKDIEQSLGMHYVGITRAKKACYIALGSQRHNKDGLRDAEPSEFLTKNEALKGLRRDVHW